MTEGQQQTPVDTKYLPELMAEKDSIDPSFVHAVRLITTEIERIKNPDSEEKGDGSGAKQQNLIDTNDGRPIKHTVLLKVPIERYPNFNFVGRLLGPGGSTLKGIQSTTSTQIAILGKGSMRDKKKAEELAAGGDAKYHHLNMPLHVKITSVSPLDQALMNISGAVSELLKLLQPSPDEMMMSPGQGGRGGMGQRGGMRGRGGRGGTQRGGAGGRGGIRGAGAQRGVGGGRGRGAAAGGRSGYGAKAEDPYAAATASYDYSALESYEGYGGEYGADASYDAYGTGTEGYGDAYGAETGYGDASYGATDYGYGDAQSYDAYGNGANASGAGQYGAAAQTGSKPFRGKMRGGGRGRASSKPY